MKDAYGSQADFEARLAGMTGGTGFDSVILCVGGSGQKLINDSFRWLRDRGKVVIVGDLTAEFSRGDMFAKEAQVLISRAGGPGRYDPQYEQENRDYPIGYVRWTEGRNTAEYIRLLAEKRIFAAPLISGIYPVEQAAAAFAEHAAPSAAVGTLLAYGPR
ncbi:zinc-binding dehydrogenase [Gordoniibacillus kamchatkensis]|uniref:zinc-binding dehydrogenase n=1 Tax=Gordoniibacillus kamchatkensis TaxID=1590651 RepID=UPI0026A023ED